MAEYAIFRPQEDAGALASVSFIQWYDAVTFRRMPASHST